MTTKKQGGSRGHAGLLFEQKFLTS